MPFFAMPDFYQKISFVDALTRVLILGELKKMPALSFDDDFKAMGLTTIS
ncbi:MAG: hypothetical protein AB1Z29_23305 [Desulfobacterales bacterium]